MNDKEESTNIYVNFPVKALNHLKFTITALVLKVSHSRRISLRRNSSARWYHDLTGNKEAVFLLNYMAELVYAEKELSDWFPERFEFYYTDC